MTLTWVVIIGVIAVGLYWISKDAEKQDAKRAAAISRGYDYAKGLVTNMHSYKGHSITVKYQVNGVYYECTNGWDKNRRLIGEGDSISLKYAIEDPNLIITELENDY